MTDIYERVDLARKELGLSFAELGELFGMTSDGVNKAIKRKNLKPNYINTFSDKYRISKTWLQGNSEIMIDKKIIKDEKEKEVPFSELPLNKQMDSLYSLLTKIESDLKQLKEDIEDKKIEKLEKKLDKLLNEDSIEIGVKHRDTKS